MTLSISHKPVALNHIAIVCCALSFLCCSSMTFAVEKQEDAHKNHKMHQQMLEQKAYNRTVAFYNPPDITLIEMDGSKVALSSILNDDKPVMLQFIFTTCPTICPMLSSLFSQTQVKLGADLNQLRMISISIDPEYDTPTRLREYANKFGAKPQWRFFTGTLTEIIAVQTAFDAYRGNKMYHESLTFLRTSPGTSWVRLNGFMSATQLVAEYRRMITNEN